MQRKTFKLREVFTPGGMPSVTYVSRENLDLERKLREALARGNAIITVSGPTKSGKTVLCRRVLQDVQPVWLDGGSVSDVEDFYNAISDHLELPQERVDEKSATRGLQGTRIEGGLSLPVAGIKISKGASDDLQQTERSSVKTGRRVKGAILQALRSSGRELVIDDFHFISSDVQRAIVNALKPEVFNGQTVVVIAVPHRAFDPIAVQSEMQGRFIHIEVGSWSVSELEQIPSIGFDALNCKVEGNTISEICREANGNPLLVQDLCFRVCQAMKIDGTQDEFTIIAGDLLQHICEKVAENSGFPIFEKLAKGAQARKDRKQRHLQGGGAVDIYELILLAVVRCGGKETTSYEELRAAIRDLLREADIPQKNEITSASAQMSGIARKMENVEPVEWHNNSLVISDPFLRFYMKWQREGIIKRLSGRT